PDLHSFPTRRSSDLKANPDLIVAQGICEVCSPYTREINRAVEILDGKPQVLILDPKNLDDILENVIQVGNKVNKIREAQDFVARDRKSTRLNSSHVA